MILITGATGKTGTEVVRQLSESGLHFRAMVHDLEKAGAIRLPGVQIVEGELSDEGSLRPALEGIDTVYLVSPPDPKQVEYETTFIRVAREAGGSGREAGVKHIVKMSVLGADPRSPVPFEAWHGEIEKALTDSGLAYTLLRPAFFMQSVLLFAPTIASEGEIRQPLGEARIAMIDVRDVAAVAVQCLTEGGHEGKVYELTGPEALSYSDITSMISSVLNREVRFEDIPREQARKEMLAMHMPEWYVEGMLKLDEQYRIGLQPKITETVRLVTGRPPRGFGQFVRDYAGRFRQLRPTEAQWEMREAA